VRVAELVYLLRQLISVLLVIIVLLDLQLNKIALLEPTLLVLEPFRNLIAKPVLLV